jgi:hypothetical protein
MLDHQVHPLSLSIGLGSKCGAHLELRPHVLPQGSPKLACELWVSIRHNVLGEAMMFESNPLDGGKLTMKSIDTLSHGPSGIGNGRNNPACFLLSVQFCWQVKQIFMYSSASSFKLGQ